MESGTTSKAKSNDSRSKFQLLKAITITMTRLATGSSQCHCVTMIRPPATTTPNETAASAAISKYGTADIQIIMPAAHKQHGCAPLITTPIAATAMTTLSFDE